MEQKIHTDIETFHTYVCPQFHHTCSSSVWFWSSRSSIITCWVKSEATERLLEDFSPVTQHVCMFSCRNVYMYLALCVSVNVRVYVGGCNVPVIHLNVRQDFCIIK